MLYCIVIVTHCNVLHLCEQWIVFVALLHGIVLCCVQCVLGCIVCNVLCRVFCIRVCVVLHCMLLYLCCDCIALYCYVVYCDPVDLVFHNISIVSWRHHVATNYQ